MSVYCSIQDGAVVLASRVRVERDLLAHPRGEKGSGKLSLSLVQRYRGEWRRHEA